VIRLPLLRLCSLLLTLLLFPRPVTAAENEVPGWQLHATAHVLLYTVPGTPAGREAEQLSRDLEDLYMQVIAPLRLPPVRIVYPLYPSVERFRQEWWRFQALGYGDAVHAWGAVYQGDPTHLTPYELTRSLVSHAFPQAIPLLRWGLADALGDRAAGIDSHQHIRALQAAGQRIPLVREVMAPSDFGDRLPLSYPMAVSFVRYLLETYGSAVVATFVDRVSYRYFEFSELFEAHFETSLEAAEDGWHRRITAASAAPIDVPSYFAAARFVYRVSLAGTPARLLLEPQGAEVVTEALRASQPLRQLDLRAAMQHLEAARRAEERAERRGRRTTLTARGVIAAVAIIPILMAIGLLLWPSVRARRYRAARRKAQAKRIAS